MSHSVVKIEVRIFKSEAFRDKYWENNGDDMFADPQEYGVSQITYATTEHELRRLTRGKPSNIMAFTKILGQPGVNEHEALHTKSLETAVDWIYNP